MDNDNIRVSIVCNAYNHENYIREALDSFLCQRTSFKFEILVHDDASTDNTANIIREYEKKYPNVIIPIYQTVNQYSMNPHISQTFQYPRAKGEFIALCEGDDYWIDPNKLQKQVDALDKHPEINICAHKGVKVSGGKKIGFVSPFSHDCVIPVEKVILGGGGFVITNSLMIRKNALVKPTPMMDIIEIDYTVQILGSLYNGMLYLSDCMAAYRVMTPGSWSAQMKINDEKMVAHRKNVIQMLTALDQYTRKKYSKTIETNIKFIELVDLERNKDFKKMLSKEYKTAFRLRSLKNRLRIRALSIVSGINSLLGQ